MFRFPQVTLEKGDRWVPMAEAAAVFGVTKETVHRWARESVLRGYSTTPSTRAKPRRFFKERDLDVFLKQKKLPTYAEWRRAMSLGLPHSQAQQPVQEMGPETKRKRPQIPCLPLPGNDRWMSVEEIAKLFGVSCETINRWRRDGELRGEKISRKLIWYRKSEVNKLLRKKRLPILE